MGGKSHTSEVCRYAYPRRRMVLPPLCVLLLTSLVLTVTFVSALPEDVFFTESKTPDLTSLHSLLPLVFFIFTYPTHIASMILLYRRRHNYPIAGRGFIYLFATNAILLVSSPLLTLLTMIYEHGVPCGLVFLGAATSVLPLSYCYMVRGWTLVFRVEVANYLTELRLCEMRVERARTKKKREERTLDNVSHPPNDRLKVEITVAATATETGTESTVLNKRFSSNDSILSSTVDSSISTLPAKKHRRAQSLGLRRYHEAERESEAASEANSTNTSQIGDEHTNGASLLTMDGDVAHHVSSAPSNSSATQNGVGKTGIKYIDPLPPSSSSSCTTRLIHVAPHQTSSDELFSQSNGINPSTIEGYWFLRHRRFIDTRWVVGFFFSLSFVFFAVALVVFLIFDDPDTALMNREMIAQGAWPSASTEPYFRHSQLHPAELLTAAPCMLRSGKMLYLQGLILTLLIPLVAWIVARLRHNERRAERLKGEETQLRADVAAADNDDEAEATSAHPPSSSTVGSRSNPTPTPTPAQHLAPTNSLAHLRASQPNDLDSVKSELKCVGVVALYICLAYPLLSLFAKPFLLFDVLLPFAAIELISLAHPLWVGHRLARAHRIFLRRQRQRTIGVGGSTIVAMPNAQSRKLPHHRPYYRLNYVLHSVHAYPVFLKFLAKEYSSENALFLRATRRFERMARILEHRLVASWPRSNEDAVHAHVQRMSHLAGSSVARHHRQTLKRDSKPLMGASGHGIGVGAGVGAGASSGGVTSPSVHRMSSQHLTVPGTTINEHDLDWMTTPPSPSLYQQHQHHHHTQLGLPLAMFDDALITPTTPAADERRSYRLSNISIPGSATNSPLLRPSGPTQPSSSVPSSSALPPSPSSLSSPSNIVSSSNTNAKHRAMARIKDADDLLSAASHAHYHPPHHHHVTTRSGHRSSGGPGSISASRPTLTISTRSSYAATRVPHTPSNSGLTKSLPTSPSNLRQSAPYPFGPSHTGVASGPSTPTVNSSTPMSPPAPVPVLAPAPLVPSSMSLDELRSLHVAARDVRRLAFAIFDEFVRTGARSEINVADDLHSLVTSQIEFLRAWLPTPLCSITDAVVDVTPLSPASSSFLESSPSTPATSATPVDTSQITLATGLPKPPPFPLSTLFKQASLTVFELIQKDSFRRFILTDEFLDLLLQADEHELIKQQSEDSLEAQTRAVMHEAMLRIGSDEDESHSPTNPTILNGYRIQMASLRRPWEVRASDPAYDYDHRQLAFDYDSQHDSDSDGETGLTHARRSTRSKLAQYQGLNGIVGSHRRSFNRRSFNASSPVTTPVTSPNARPQPSSSIGTEKQLQLQPYTLNAPTDSPWNGATGATSAASPLELKRTSIEYIGHPTNSIAVVGNQANSPTLDSFRRPRRSPLVHASLGLPVSHGHGAASIVPITDHSPSASKKPAQPSTPSTPITSNETAHQSGHSNNIHNRSTTSASTVTGPAQLASPLMKLTEFDSP